jgi:hypothetical protein
MKQKEAQAGERRGNEEQMNREEGEEENTEKPK